MNKKSAGLCTNCASPAFFDRCAVCLEKLRTYRRNKYRKKHGIPLDAPLDNRGRPRKEPKP